MNLSTAMPFNPTDIVNQGAGVVALALVFYLVFFWTKNISPILSNINSKSELNTEIIKNNTEALHSMSQSTANVAAALKILESTFDGYTGTIEDLKAKVGTHDIRSEQIHKDIIEIKASLNQRGVSNGNH